MEGEEGGKKGCHINVLDHIAQTVCVSVCPGTHNITVRAVQVQFGSGLVKTRFFLIPMGAQEHVNLYVCVL